MGTVKISKSIPYTRFIPDIIGEKAVYDLDNLLVGDATVLDPFVAQVFPGTLMFGEDNVVEMYPTGDVDAFHVLIENNDEIRLSELFSSSPQTTKKTDIVIPLMRPGFDIYGHWLLDLLPKLAVFERMNPKVAYKILVDERCPKWALELISLLFHNFTTIEKIKVGESMTGSFFLTSPVRHHDFISEMCKIDITMPTDDSEKNRKIYISRKHLNLNHRQLTNSARIEKLFQSKEFELIYPEELSIRDQMVLFSQTAVLAGEAGSGLHNSIFCPKDVVLINIQSGRQNHFIQAGLCDQYGQSSIYVAGKAKTDDWGSSFKARLKDCKIAIKKASLR